MADVIEIDGPKPYGLDYPGFAFDIRPGINSKDWVFDGAFAWPVPTGASIITLQPAPINPLWETQVFDPTDISTFPYERWTEDNFILTGQVTRYARRNFTDWVLLSKQETLTATTKTPYNEGDGIFLEFNVAGRFATGKLLFQLKFGNTNATKTFWLSVYENGSTYLSRGNTPIGISDTDRQLAEGSIVPNKYEPLTNRWIQLFVLPHGGNRVLLTSSTGAGFHYEDLQIPRTNTQDNNAGAKPVNSDKTQPLLKQSPVTLYAYTKLAFNMRTIPFTGNIIGDHTTGSIYPKNKSLLSFSGFPASGTAFNVNDVKNSAVYDFYGMPNETPTVKWVGQSFIHNKLDDETNQLIPTIILKRPKENVSQTPQLFRVEASYKAIPSTKADHKVPVHSDMIELTHTQSETGLTGKVRIRNAELYKDYINGFGLPFDIKNGLDTYLFALLLAPKLINKGDPKQGLRKQYIEWDFQGLEKDLMEGIVSDITRLDNLAIDDAAKKLLIALGWPDDGSQWDIDSTEAVAISGEKISKTSEGVKDDNATNLTDVARYVHDWLKYLIDTYTSAGVYPFQWVMGFRPYFTGGHYQWRFFLKNPDNFDPNTPAWIFYPSRVLALSDATAIAKGCTYLNSNTFVHFNTTEIENIPPECNQLDIYGLNDGIQPDFQNLISSLTSLAVEAMRQYTIPKRFIDKPSADGNLALGARPKNWLGKKKQVVYIDGGLNTEALVQAAGAKVFKRLSTSYQRTSIEVEWNPIIRIWDYIKIYTMKIIPIDSVVTNINNYDVNTWLVTGISVKHNQDSTLFSGIKQRRPCTLELRRANV